MANPTCPRCGGTGIDPKTQQPCTACGGDGVLDLLDPGFLEAQIPSMLSDSGYLVWAVLYAGLINEMEKFNDLTGKVNDVISKQADIVEKLDEIKTVVDAL